jgi:long-chain acyl-CoA synthetase
MNNTAGPPPHMVTGAATLTAAFARTVRERPEAVALRAYNSGRELTWRDYGEQACRVAAGLRRAGLRRGARVALMMRNRPMFHVVDMGVLLAGGTPFSVYNSSSSQQLSYLLHNAGAQIVVVEDVEFLDRVLAARAELPALRRIVTLEKIPGVEWLGDLMAVEPLELEPAAAAITPSELATVIYTSGTTGDPKGVMLTHANLIAGVEGYTQVLGHQLTGMRTVSALPMAHIAERNATHYYHVCMGSHVTTCDDISTLGAAISDVHPHWLFGTPRLWLRYQSAIEARLDAEPELRRAVEEARALARQLRQCRATRQPLPPGLASGWDRARARTLEPLLAHFGLDELRIANSGASPMPGHTTEFFLDLGVPLSDVYGQSEAAGSITWDPHDIVPGTSGKPLPGLRVRSTLDGEVVLKGAALFAGYLGDPAATRKAFDRDGWFHTGDIGQFTGRGHLRILDRKKELIVTTGGKNISPAFVESTLTEHPLIAHAVAIGDGRAHLTALLVLDPDTAPAWADQRGLPTDVRELSSHADLLAEIAPAVDAANARLNAAEQIRSHAIVGDTWAPDTELLTPTGKLKRRGIHARYAAEIDAMYATRGAYLG